LGEVVVLGMEVDAGEGSLPAVKEGIFAGETAVERKKKGGRG